MYLRGAERHVDRRGEELEYEPPAVPDSFRIGLDLHARLDLARTGRHEHARALQLDDADPADVDGRQGLELAEGGRVDAELAACVQDGRAFEHLELVSVDAHFDEALRQSDEHSLSH